MAASPSLEDRFAPALAALRAEGVARDFASVAMPGNGRCLAAASIQARPWSRRHCGKWTKRLVCAWRRKR